MDGTIRYAIRPYDTIWTLAQVFNTTVESIMELNPGINPTNLLSGQVIMIMPGYPYASFYQGGTAGGTSGGMAGGVPGGTAGGVEERGALDELTMYFRMLWEQHIVWDWIVALGLINNLPGTDLYVKRLLENATDFANALEPYYGEELASEFGKLFAAHITIAGEVIQAAKAKNEQALTDAEKRWYDNADQIAALMARMNPNWKEDDWSAMLREHLDLLKANIEDMINGKHEESIEGLRDIESQALEMADMMAEGIALQFPY